MARGVFAINYERMLSSKFCFGLGAGPTYRDFLYELGQGDDMWEDYNSNLKVNPGIYLEGNLRYYPVEGDFEGFYLSPSIRYRSYNLKTNYDESTYSNFSVGYNETDIGFTVGIQNEMGYTGILVDSYFGVAYRNRVRHNEVFDENDEPTGTNKTNTWAPALMLGFKIGFPF